ALCRDGLHSSPRISATQQISQGAAALRIATQGRSYKGGDTFYECDRPAGLPPSSGLGYTRGLFTEFARVASPWKSNRS
ncbi:hypothetical protein, partial [Pseudomonas sp. S13.1.2]|uniref:hypothetical protein n=1 Tax=Pseudomonas sp. S13.1.2 TaxID=1217722 RepID=UPI001C45D83F